MTPFAHKITHNKAGIIVLGILGLGWPRKLSPVETPVSKFKEPPNCFKDFVVSLQLLGLPAEVVIWNKQQLG